MSKQLILPTAVSLVLFCVVVADAQTNLTERVRSAEIAFAKSMADRDAAAFASLIADEAVFFDKECPPCDCSAKP